VRGLSALAAIALSGCGGATHSATPTTGTAAPASAAHTPAGVDLLYKAGPTPTSPDSSASRTRAAAIIRAELRGVVPAATVRVNHQAGISVFLPGVSPGAPLTREVGANGQLEFYDWEANVIGPTGRAEPAVTAVTGGPDAGSAGSGITLYEAVLRASRRPEVDRPSDTTLGNGLHGVWYLVDRRAHKVLAGPEQTRAALSGKHAAPRGSTVVHVQPGTVIVAAESPNGEPDPTLDSYYVLNDAPALSTKDITDPREAVDSGPGGSGQPSVTFNFTTAGRRIFESMTATIARRGRERSAPAQTDLQHFAIVLDNRLISVPSIDFNQYPDGVEATNGSEISGAFTTASSRVVAQLLATGGLPVELTLVSERPSP